MGKARDVLSGAEIIASSVEQNLNGLRFRVPSIDHRVIHHVVHSQLTSPRYAATSPNLRDLTDFLFLQQRYPNQTDWQSVYDVFARSQNTAALATYLAFLSDSFGWAPPLPLKGSTWRTDFQVSHRKFLSRNPPLRFIDPIYWLDCWFTFYLARWKQLTGTPEGVKYLLTAPFRKSFYRNLLQGV
jgi:hypothetical protein